MSRFTTTQWRWSIQFLFLLLVAMPATGSKEVRAADDAKYGAEWEITMKIQGGKIQAFWNGRVWKYGEADDVVIAEKSLNISADCESLGGPQFSQNQVTLDGVDDYIRCKIPNFPAIFRAMVEEIGLKDVLGRCRCYFDGPPYVAADVTPVYSKVPQPVVYHNRLFLDVLRYDTKSVHLPFVTGKEVTNQSSAGTASNLAISDQPVRVDANNNLGLARLTLKYVDGTTENWQSNHFNSSQNNGFQIWAGYDVPRYLANNTKTGFAKFLAAAGFWDVVQPQYTDGFFMWESEAQSLYSGEAMPSSFGLASGSYIYFGYNPTTDSYFKGTMRAVAVDPGCRGH